MRGQPVEVALNAEDGFGLVIPRCQLRVGERPIGDVGAGDRPERAVLGEVDVPEPGDLRVPEDRAAAHRGRQGIDQPDHAGGGLGGASAERARVDQRIGQAERPP